MNYLGAEDVLEIHSVLVDETGGSHGVRDNQSIASAVEQPRQTFGGKELYETVFEKAAVLCRAIIQNHPFIDGNKRTAMTAAGVFLELNGYMLVAPEGDVAHFALLIIEEKSEIQDIARWFKNNSKKL
ncbi:MAG: type II toxin-antitoxin system death-on-curing family toxin [Candidatus Paceibacterota bacterium]